MARFPLERDGCLRVERNASVWTTLPEYRELVESNVQGVFP